MNRSSVPREDPSSDVVPARVAQSGISWATRGRRKVLQPQGNHARPRDAGPKLRRKAVITERLLPTVPELGEKRGQMPESGSSARFQGFPSSPLFQTLLPSPVSGEGCSPPAKHERHQRGSVQGKASTGRDFFAGRCFRQTDARTAAVGASTKGAGRGSQPPAT